MSPTTSRFLCSAMLNRKLERKMIWKEILFSSACPRIHNAYNKMLKICARKINLLNFELET
jgi:hypothetical protein